MSCNFSRRFIVGYTVSIPFHCVILIWLRLMTGGVGGLTAVWMFCVNGRLACLPFFSGPAVSDAARLPIHKVLYTL